MTIRAVGRCCVAGGSARGSPGAGLESQGAAEPVSLAGRAQPCLAGGLTATCRSVMAAAPATSSLPTSGPRADLRPLPQTPMKPPSKALLVTAPVELREQLRGLPATMLVPAAAALEPGAITSPLAAAMLALRTVAQRYQTLDAEITILTAELDRLVAMAAPKLLALFGAGQDSPGALLVATGDNPDRLHSEAAFSMLWGLRRSRRPWARPSAIASIVVETDRPTPRSTGSCWCGCATTSPPRPTPAGASPRARPSGRSSAVSLGDYPGRGSRVGPWLLGERQGTASLPRRVTASFSSAAP